MNECADCRQPLPPGHASPICNPCAKIAVHLVGSVGARLAALGLTTSGGAS